MSPIEMARVVAAVVFLAVAGYSAARFAWSVTRRGGALGILAADVPDLSHALMGVAMALMVSPAGPAVPEPLGIAAFTALAAWFAARLRHDGLLSRAALPALAAAKHRLADLGDRDGRARGHGRLPPAPSGRLRRDGRHVPDRPRHAGSRRAGDRGHGDGRRRRRREHGCRTGLDAHGALGAHAALPPLAALCWVLGLYFLVATTSLGFRVGESTVQLAHHAAATPNASAARLLTSPAGACATEVALSAGMAVLFFSAL